MQTSHHISKLEKENARLRSESADWRSRSEAARAEAASAGQERDRYKDQYLALFKQHQQSSDAIQSLKGEKERLQIQLGDFQREDSSDGNKKVVKKKSSSPAVPQLQVSNH